MIWVQDRAHFSRFWIEARDGTNAYLARHDRALLERRLAIDEHGEEQSVHKLFFALLRVLMLALLVVPGLDHRYGWSTVPLALQLAGFAWLLAGHLLTFLVMRENIFARLLPGVW